MPGSTRIIKNLHNSIDLLRTQQTARYDLIEQRLDSIDMALDSLIKSRKTKEEKSPLKVPPRPEIMKLAEVGQDPR